MEQINPDLVALRIAADSAFRNGDYRHCLGCLKQLIRDYSDNSAEVRLAFGNCLIKLGSFAKAGLAYERALQIDATCTSAKVGLAVIKFLQGYTEESFTLFRDLLSSGDSECHRQLSLLCEDLCASQNVEVVCDLGEIVFSRSQDNRLRGTMAYKIGRRLHEQYEYDSAVAYYEAAAYWMRKENTLPLFGLGQVYFCRQQFEKALGCFQKLLKRHPQNADIFRLLGFTHYRLDVAKQGSDSTRSQARICLEQALPFMPDDKELLFVLAQCCEVDDSRKALDYYLKLLQLYDKDKSSPPVELFNNISSLYFCLCDYQNSRRFSDLAFDSMLDHKTNSKALEVTLLYNNARIYEALGEMEAAKEEFAIVLQMCPKYFDACLRMAQLEHQAGNSVRAHTLLKSAIEATPSNSNHLILRGDFLMAEKAYKEAHDMYAQALRSSPPAQEDIYTMLKFGNVCLELFHEESIPAAKTDWAQTAYMTFRKVLHIDPTTPYAVNGMGIILANNGDVGLEMFKLVQETSPSYADAWFNAGHVFLSRKEFEKAVEMHSQAVKIEPGNPTFLTALSRAQFNLANVLKTTAVATLRKGQTGSVISVDELSHAIKDLESAQVFFQSLSLSDRTGRAKSADRALRESNVCCEILKRSVPQMERALEVADREKKDKKPGSSLTETTSEQISPRVGKRTSTQLAGTGKGKMARSSMQAKQFLEKRSRKYAQLEDLPNDTPFRVPNCPQREPQRKRAKAVAGDEMERRRRKFAERKRREEEIEKIMLSSDDDSVVARKRPVRRRPVDLTGIQIRRRPPPCQNCSNAEDASCSAVNASESENHPPQSLSVSPGEFSDFRPSVPFKLSLLKVEEAETSPSKQLTKSNSDETHSEAVFVVPLVPKRHFSDGDDVTRTRPTFDTFSSTQHLSPASSREEKSKILKAEPDDVAKRSNCSSESESRKRKGSVHAASSSESTCA